MGHENAETMRRGYEAFGKGDMETMNELLADDVEWHTPGDNALAGTYKGKEEVFGLFGRIAEMSDFSQEIHDLLANDDHAVALVKTTATRGGKTVQQNAVHVAHIEDGKLTSFWAHNYDQAAMDDLFSD